MIDDKDFTELCKTVYTLMERAYEKGFEASLEDAQPYAPEFVKNVYKCWSKG